MWIKKKENNTALLAIAVLVVLGTVAIYPAGLFAATKEQCRGVSGFAIIELSDGNAIVPEAACKKLAENAKATTIEDAGIYIERSMGWDAYASMLDSGENNIIDELQRRCKKEYSGRIAQCGYGERFYCCVS